MSKFSGKLFIVNKNKKTKLNTSLKNSGMNDANSVFFNQQSCLPQLYTGSNNRMDRYRMYDVMEMDPTIDTALNVLSDFISQGSPDDDMEMPFKIKYKEELSDNEIDILTTGLEDWCELNNFSVRIFDIVKNTLKYGDTFFIRDPETYELLFVDPYNIDSIVVDEARGKKPESFRIKNVDVNLQAKTVSSSMNSFVSPHVPTNVSNYSIATHNSNGLNTFTSQGTQTTAVDIDAKHVVHISLNTNGGSTWPFGVSVLEKAFKVYKQKELLEDAAVIYRIQRAPERRVFHIDVGEMSTEKANAYLERVKNEISQSRLPARATSNEGENIFNVTDSRYNPMSMLDDYYFAKSTDGAGSSVEVLPGGQNLDHVSELLYFDTRLIRTMDIPSSYIPTTNEDGTKTYTAGKIGEILVQEVRFAKKCRRYQKIIMKNLSDEFHYYMNAIGVKIPNDSYSISFNDMMNMEEWLNLELLSSRINLLTQIDNVPYIAKKTILTDILGWSQDKITENKHNWVKENVNKLKKKNIDVNLSTTGYEAPGLSSLGINEITTDDIRETDEIDELDEVDETADIDETTDTVETDETDDINELLR